MFKFCILAAGLGTRNTFYKGLHKALLPIDNRPAISYILDNVPKDVEVVVAVGYLKEQLISYLTYVYPERKFTFVEVDPYQGENSGPGVSLLQCKEHLQCPFIFTSVDTILSEKVIHEAPTFDWIGVDKTDSITYACLVDNNLTRIEVPPIYIGIAGIANWKEYFIKLEESKSTEVTAGFDYLEKIPFNWTDTGSDASYTLLRHSKIVPPKSDQVLLIDNQKVVKIFLSADKAKRVYKRTLKSNKNCELIHDMFVVYPFINGTLFSDMSPNLDFLTYSILDKINFSLEKPKDFSEMCNEMYFNKTTKRVASLLQRYPDLDKIESINGVKVRPISYYFNIIPWDYINESSIASPEYHGDLQPENIIIDSKFSPHFIDYRDGFAGNTAVGDLYYDLGKLWHGCLVSNQKVMLKQYDAEINGTEATISIATKPILLRCLFLMEKYCKYHNLDFKKVELLGALQYITIATLYNDEKYASFLFLLGKLILEKLEDGTNQIIKSIQS